MGITYNEQEQRFEFDFEHEGATAQMPSTD